MAQKEMLVETVKGYAKHESETLEKVVAARNVGIGAKTAEDKKEIAKGLKSSAGYIRRQVAQRLNLRITPELTFVEDTSITYGAHIAELLNGITYADDAEESDADDTDDTDDTDEVEDDE